MAIEGTPAGSSRRWWAEAVGGGLLYLALGALVLLLQHGSGSSLWYPPVALGALLAVRLGLGVLPVVFACDLVLSRLQFGGANPSFVVVASGTALEVFLAQRVLVPLARKTEWDAEATVRTLVAGVVPPLVGATLGAPLLAKLAPGAGPSLLHQWLVWWLGDGTSLATLLPVGLAMFVVSPLRGRHEPDRATRTEVVAVYALAAVLAHWVYVERWQTQHLEIEGAELAAFLPVVWGAMRFRPRLAFGLVAWLALVAAVGAFERPAVHPGFQAGFDERLLSAQLQAVGLALLVLVVVAMRESQRSAHARLERSERALRVAQATARLGSFEWSHATGQVRWSEGLYHLLRLDRSTPASIERWRSYVHPEDLAASEERLREAPEQLPAGPLRQRLALPDGTELHVELRLERDLDRDGEPVTRGTVLDVSETVALERRFMHAQRLESVGRLAGGVAHDFNNLLTVIRGFVELAKLDLRVPDLLARHLDEVDRAAERGSRLTGELLALSRRSTRDVRPVDVGELVLEFERTLHRIIGEDVLLEIQAFGGQAWVEGDAGQIEQALLNLVVNARDAMPHGGRLTVRVQAERPPGERGNGTVVLTVSDTGVGMDRATRERVFEPFFTTKEPGKGTGLGLATVHGLVQQHGGSVELESEPGRGTRFRIVLPACVPPPAVEPPRRLTARAPGKGTVLLVEDDAALRRFAREALEREGFRVTSAGDAVEARAWVLGEGERPDVLITDVVLPGADGLELAQELRELAPGLRVIYMTGYLGDPRDPSRREPDSVVLRKPFRIEELVAAMAPVPDVGVRGESRAAAGGGGGR